MKSVKKSEKVNEFNVDGSTHVNIPHPPKLDFDLNRYNNSISDDFRNSGCFVTVTHIYNNQKFELTKETRPNPKLYDEQIKDQAEWQMLFEKDLKYLYRMAERLGESEIKHLVSKLAALVVTRFKLDKSKMAEIECDIYPDLNAGLKITFRQYPNNIGNPFVYWTSKYPEFSANMEPTVDIRPRADI